MPSARIVLLQFANGPMVDIVFDMNNDQASGFCGASDRQRRG